MLISVFARGRGAGSGPVNYVTAETVRAMDAEGKPIPGQMLPRDPAPVLMAGDPGLTRALIDSSSNQWKYTSGVISFERSDAPTDAEQRAVMADFERLAFAGLAKDEYNVLWVKHEHCGNVELHFVAPRLHLGTGKAYNPCPPGHQAAHDALRDAWNCSEGWADPADPGRARMTKRDDHQIKIEASALRAGLALADDPKALIGAYLVQRLEDGQIQNRADLLAALEETGLTISRQGKDYVSVRDGDAKPIRLKGIIYDSNFAFGFDRAAEIRRELGLADRPAQEQDQGRRAGDQRVDAERADRARQQLEATIGRRAQFNAGRYQPAERDAATAERDAGHNADGANELSTDAPGASPGAEERGPERGPEHEGLSSGRSQAGQGLSRDGSQKTEAEREPLLGQAEALGLDAVGRGGRELPLSLRSDLGLVGVGGTVDHGANAGGAVSSHKGPVDNNVQHSDRPEALPTGQLKENDGGRTNQFAGINNRLYSVFSRLRAAYDRVRKSVGDSLRSAWQAIRNGHEQLVFASAGIEQATGRIDSANQQLGQAIGRSNNQQREISQGADHVEQQTERACRGLKMQREDELDRFKTDINLVEFAASKGYKVSKLESSRASTVMVDDQGDKIIVATDTDGHGIYFSVRDDKDNGSVIDFVQKRQGLNLGQVRKELRSWCSSSASYRPTPEAARQPKPKPSSRDRTQVLAKWMQMQPAAEHPYLIDERKLTPETLADPRFAGHVRIDGRGNAVFPHFDRHGLTGYELKNEGFTGFANGGEKGLWYSTNRDHAPRIVVVESAIDALSHAQLSGDQEAAYISVGGAMSDKQCNLIAELFAKATERGAIIVLATDADEPGRKLAGQLRDLAPASATIERQEPPYCKDWNDEIKQSVVPAPVVATAPKPGWY